jgi:hypothetical protein
MIEDSESTVIVIKFLFNASLKVFATNHLVLVRVGAPDPVKRDQVIKITCCLSI